MGRRIAFGIAVFTVACGGSGTATNQGGPDGSAASGGAGGGGSGGLGGGSGGLGGSAGTGGIASDGGLPCSTWCGVGKCLPDGTCEVQSGVPGTTDLTEHNGELFTAMLNGIIKYPLDGSAGFTKLTEGNSNIDSHGLWIVGNEVFWTGASNATIGKSPLATQASTPLYTSETLPRRITESGGYLYWASESKNSIRRAPIAGGGTITDFATGLQGPFEAIADGSDIYFSDQKNVVRCPAGPTCTPTVLASSTPTDILGGYGLQLDATYVYALTNQNVIRVPKSGGTPEPMLEAGSQPHGFHVSGGFIYYTTGNFVSRAPVSGGTFVNLVEGQSQPGEILVAGGFVWFVVIDFPIWSLKKVPVAG